MKTKRLSAVVVVLLLLASCGGGGSKTPSFTADAGHGADGADKDLASDAGATDFHPDKGFADTQGNELPPVDGSKPELPPLDGVLPDARDVVIDGGTVDLKDVAAPEEVLSPDTAQDTVCKPDCPLLSCGPDGCGWLCQCPNGYGCTVEEPLTCKPDCALVCAGRLCGNAGVLGECFCGECEDDNLCTMNVCNEKGECSYPNSDVECDDGDPCTGADKCTEGGCVGSLLGLGELISAQCLCGQDEDCLRFEDGDACNGTVFCSETDGLKVCSVDPGSVPNCDDGNPCTRDSCDPQGGCVHEALDVVCSDGNPCTVGDWCRDGQCAPGADTKDCDDGEPCTDDLCDPQTVEGCVNPPNQLPCTDGNPCTEGDRCLNGICVGGIHDKDCNDKNPCTDDLCDPKVAGGCKYVFNANPCQDDDPCTLGELCKDGECLGNGMLSCEDNNVCTTDSCAKGVGCVNTPIAGECSDGNSCTKNDTCQGGVCAPGTNTCTCLINADCDQFNDQDYCNGTYSCNWKTKLCEILPSSVVKCLAPPVPICTESRCDPKDALCRTYVVNDGKQCEDNNPCTVGDICTAGVCKSGLSMLDCDDNNPCTEDYCDPKVAGGCVHTNNTRPCDDNNPCTLLDFCYEGKCTPGGTKKVCVDNNICTQDTCDPKVPGGCSFPPADGPCDDGDPCSIGDACSEGACRSGKDIKDCNDNNVCTKDVCVPLVGCQYSHAPGPCNDGIACTRTDTCVNSKCVGTPYTCNAPGFCETTVGAVCKGDGTCTYPAAVGAVCNDNIPCTRDDKCTAGKTCEGTPFTCTTPGYCEILPGTCNGSGCTYLPNTGELCNDNNPCTHSDKCQANHTCSGITYSCVAPGYCEKSPGTCDGNGGCAYSANVGGACNDNVACTREDKCTATKSCAGTPYTCNSPGYCEANPGECNGSGCTYPANSGAVCDDGNACSFNDRCQWNKTCSGTGYSCNSPGYCERAPGSCNGSGGCSYSANTGAGCNDNNICSYNDACQSNKTCSGVGYDCNGHGTCRGDGSCNCDSCHQGDHCQDNKWWKPSCW